MAKWVAMMCLCLAAAACGGSSDPEPVVCGPGNCTGCCFNNACQTGSTAAACGHGGAACSACGTNQVCLPALACGFDPAQLWDVTLVSATVKPTNNGTNWDADASAPDTYGSFLDGAMTTTIQQDTYTPVWSPSEGIGGSTVELLGGFHFQLFDLDAIVDDPITGVFTLTVPEAAFSSGSFTVGPVDGAESITFLVVKSAP